MFGKCAGHRRASSGELTLHMARYFGAVLCCVDVLVADVDYNYSCFGTIVSYLLTVLGTGFCILGSAVQ
jgi:hypothetical protein